MKTSSVRTVAISALALVAAAGSALGQLQGPSSSQTPYMTPIAPGVITQSLISVGDAVNGYRAVGIMDGIGSFSNSDGTITVLVNHELGATLGAVRRHGNTGAFVSRWIIDPCTRAVRSGDDLIETPYVWNGTDWVVQATQFGRLCSADLPEVSAFYNASTGRGTQNRIFMHGEEVGAEGRGWGSIATGPATGESWELPHTGKFSWENSVASPLAQDKTIVVGLDDSSPGQVYVYVGTKQDSGNDITRAGLTGGTLYGIKVEGLPDESRNSAFGLRNFSLYSFGDVSNKTGAQLQADSEANGVTEFLRPEDGAWDPNNPNDFYFCTTDRYDQVKDGVGSQIGRTRLFRVRFIDITQPELGGTIEDVLDGTEPTNMMDNLGFDRYGNILIVEDVGNQQHNGKVWQYKVATDTLTLLAQHDVARFGDIGIPAQPPFSQDEEFSGIVDATRTLGPGWWLVDDQAHYNIGDAELVEGGQLLAMFNPGSCPGDFNLDGVVDSDDFFDFLNAYYASDCRADINLDGSVDSDDFFDYLNSFYAGC